MGPRRPSSRSGLALLCAGAALLGGPATARADADAASRDRPTRPLVGPRQLDDSSAAVTVVTRDQLDALGVESVSEALRIVPGVSVTETGARGGFTELFVRGAEANFTSVEIDGVRMNASTNSRGGAFDFSLLDVEEIERIEIARGAPPPGIEGASAGAVRIFTRRGDAEPRLRLDASSGVFGFDRVAASADGALGAFDWALGFSSTDQGHPIDASEYRGEQSRVRVGFQPAEGMRLEGRFRFGDFDQESLADPGGGEDYPANLANRLIDRRDTQQTLYALAWTHAPSERFDYDVTLSRTREREDFEGPPLGSFPSGFPIRIEDSRFQRDELRANARFGLTDRIDLRAGAELAREHGEQDGQFTFPGLFSFASAFDEKRRNRVGFAELEWRPLDALRVQLGARRDDWSNDRDADVTPRVGVLWQIASSDTAVRLNMGRGHKEPSLYALFHPLVGNPGFDPEESSHLEIGATQYFWDRRASLDVAVFHSHYDDLIDFQGAALVARDVEIDGFELTGAVQATPELAFSANLTLADQDVPGGEPDLRLRPEWSGGLHARWRPRAELDLSVSGVYASSRLDDVIPPAPFPSDSERLDAYFRLDVSGSWRIREGLRVYARLENALGERYEERIGFPAPRFNARFGVALEL